MTPKEFSEIRRRFNIEKTNIGLVRGCFVNDSGQIISRFSESLHLMSNSDKEKLIAVIKRALSGSIGKNLLDLSFSTSQVADSDEHRLLMSMVRSKLKDDDAVEMLFSKIITSAQIEGSYLILCCNDNYDVPYKDNNGETSSDSNSMHSYMVCAVCPTKLTKPELSYITTECRFESCAQNTVISSPVIGFTFPTFDDRATNVYNVMYYTKSSSDIQGNCIESLFNIEPPMPADSQKAVFNDILVEGLQEECNLYTVNSVNETISMYIEEQKELESNAVPFISQREFGNILSDSGINKEKVEVLVNDFKERFGENTEVSIKNLAEKKQELTTPDVKISINVDSPDVVKTQIIDGVKYIMVKVTGDIELNGVPIKI